MHVTVIAMDKVNTRAIRDRFCSITFIMGTPWFPRDCKISILEQFCELTEKYPCPATQVGAMPMLRSVSLGDHAYVSCKGKVGGSLLEVLLALQTPE